MSCCGQPNKKRRVDIPNSDLIRLRLSDDEKKYYSELFFNHSVNNGTVAKDKFPDLMGLLGTDIACSFAMRIFDTFSADGKTIKLEEYLKYIDVYHHGNDKERCLITYRFMDVNNDNKVDFKEFENYINLINNAIKRVHPGAEDDLLSTKEIQLLFNKISNNKQFFSYSDFEVVYYKKPLLLSWVDYFKNNDHELLGFINKNVKTLIVLLERFNGNMSKILENILQLNGKTFNFTGAIIEISKYCKAIELRRKELLKKNSFNIRNIFDNLGKSSDINVAHHNQKHIINARNKFSGVPRTAFSGGMNKKFEFSDKHVYQGSNLDLFEKHEVPIVNHDIVDPMDNTYGRFQTPVERGKSITNFGGSRKFSTNKFDDFNLYSEGLATDSNNIKNQMQHLKKRIIDDNYKDEDDYVDDDIVVEEESAAEESNTKTFDNHKRIDYIGGSNKSNVISSIDDMLYDQNSRPVSTSHLLIKSNNAISEVSKGVNINNSVSNSTENIVKSMTNDVQNQNLTKRQSQYLYNQVKEDDDIDNEMRDVNSERGVETDKIDDLQNKALFKNEANYEEKYSKSFHGSQSPSPNIIVKPSPVINEIKMDVLDDNITFKQPTVVVTKVVNDEPAFVKSKFKPIENLRVDAYIGGSNGSNANTEIDKYNHEIKGFVQALANMFKGNLYVVTWLSCSYHWVEDRYLKNEIKKKESTQVLAAENKINKPMEQKRKKITMSKDTILKVTDDNFKLLLNMIMGIQLAVNSTSNITLTAESELLPYLKSSKHTLASANFTSSSLEGIFYIVNYAGVLFNNIRRNYGIDKDIYIQSISLQDFITEMMISSTTIIEELFSTSKSGSLFYHTRDGKYILKTISEKEYRFFRKILGDYFKHLMSNKYTLLPKFYGCYKLIRKIGKAKVRMYFITMDNVFGTHREIQIKYDLKGSKTGREVLNKLSEEERKENTYAFALKDLDFDKTKQQVAIGDKKENLISQIKIDTDFLRKKKIIDYSLLIGIHRVDSTKKIFDDIKKEKLELDKQARANMFRSVKNVNLTNPFYKSAKMRQSENRVRMDSDENLNSGGGFNINFNNQMVFTEEIGGDNNVSLMDYSISTRDLNDSEEDELLDEPEKHPFSTVYF